MAGSAGYRPVDRFVLERPRADAIAGVAGWRAGRPSRRSDAGVLRGG